MSATEWDHARHLDRLQVEADWADAQRPAATGEHAIPVDGHPGRAA